MAIVAGRVKEKFNRPALVAGIVEGLVKGSGRSVLFEARSVAELAVLQLLALIRRLDDTTLLGPILADRYLSADYRSTPAELQAMADRWAVVELLERSLPYREIHKQTGVSVTTIGRVARYLTSGNGGYRAVTERLKLDG